MFFWKQFDQTRWPAAWNRPSNDLSLVHKTECIKLWRHTTSHSITDIYRHVAKTLNSSLEDYLWSKHWTGRRRILNLPPKAHRMSQVRSWGGSNLEILKENSVNFWIRILEHLRTPLTNSHPNKNWTRNGTFHREPIQCSTVETMLFTGRLHYWWQEIILSCSPTSSTPLQSVNMN